MKLIILGAGLAGLSAAWHARDKCDYELYEQELEVGGLCRSFYIDGFTFDFTGHLLHLRDPYFQNLIGEIMGKKLIANQRDARIYSKNVYTRYPFQENTFGLPPRVIRECVDGYRRAVENRREREPRNFHDWIIYQFGEGVARHFMVPYNEKMFTVHPREMSTSWLGRFIPRPELERVIAGSVADMRSESGYNAEFFYPRRGGIGLLAKTLLSDLSSVKPGHKCTKIDVKAKKVYFEKGVEAVYDKLITTIPLPELMSLIDELPETVKEAAQALRCNSVYCLNLGVNREKINPFSWIYFPEPEYCFYRVGFYSNLNPASAPPGTSSLYAEVSYSNKKPINKNEIKSLIYKDLEKVAILRNKDEILVEQELDIKYAYVIYDKKRDAARNCIVKYLQTVDIRLAGRYGDWSYMAMEDAMRSGKEASEGILQS